MIRRFIFITLCTAVCIGAQTATTKTYATPEEARDALVQAAANGMDAVRTLLGPGSNDVIRTGDPVLDKVVLIDLTGGPKKKRKWFRTPYKLTG